MASSECQLHINSLPDGILQEVFRYLSLTDRKTAALVCSLWEQEAFSAGLLANVRLCMTNTCGEAFLEVLRNSWRPYRNVVVCDMRLCGTVLCEFVMALLDIFGTTIEEFIMKNACTAAQVKGFAEKMPNLRKMVIFVRESEKLSVEPLEFPVLRRLHEVSVWIKRDHGVKSCQLDMLRMAPNVQQLRIQYRFHDEKMFDLLERCANQLRSLHLFAYCYPFPIHTLRFENLIVLKLQGVPQLRNFHRLSHMLRGMRKLKAIHLDYRISTTTLAVVCNSCPKLETLDIRADGLEAGSFDYLSDTPHLQVFMVQYLHIGLLEQAKPINGIKNLHIYVEHKAWRNEAFVDNLFKVFPNVCKMKYIHRQDTVYKDHIGSLIMHRICSKFTHLTKLTISAERCQNDFVLSIEPGGLGNVEELHCVQTSEFREPTMENSVKRLIIHNVDPAKLFLSNMTRSFPKLKYLEIRSCAATSSEFIAEIRRNFPQCIVHCEFMTKLKWKYK